MTAEAESVAECEIDRTMGRCIKSKVERRDVGVVVEMVDSRRDDIVFDSEDGSDSLGGASSAHKVPHHRLGSVEANLRGIGAKEEGDSLSFGDIADRGGGAVGIDMVDIGEAHTRVEDSLPHSDESAVALRVRRGDMERIGGEAGASHFGIDFSAASAGVVEVFEDESGAAFAHDEAVAVAVERSRSGGRVIVASREGLHRRESADSRLTDRELGAAGDDSGTLAKADDVESGRDSGGRRGASGSGGEIRASEAELDRDMSGTDVEDCFRDKERAKTRKTAVVEEIVTAVLKSLSTAHTDAPDNAYSILIDIDIVEGGIEDSLGGGDDSILREEVKFFNLLAVEEIERVVVFNFAGDAGFEERGVEAADRGSGGDTLEQGIPHNRGRITERGNSADASNNNPFEIHAEKLLFDVLLDIIDSIADSKNLFGLIFRDSDVEFLFDIHDEVDGVERVGAEVGGKIRIRGDIGFFDTEFINNYSFKFSSNISHFYHF